MTLAALCFPRAMQVQTSMELAAQQSEIAHGTQQIECLEASSNRSQIKIFKIT